MKKSTHTKKLITHTVSSPRGWGHKYDDNYLINLWYGLNSVRKLTTTVITHYNVSNNKHNNLLHYIRRVFQRIKKSVRIFKYKMQTCDVTRFLLSRHFEGLDLDLDLDFMAWATRPLQRRRLYDVFPESGWRSWRISSCLR